MVERIGRDSALAREAMRAAQRFAAERAGGPGSAAPAPETAATPGADFAHALEEGVRHIDRQVQSAESLPVDLLTGKVDDFHEIAVQLKSAELSFKFAMEIRNKLVDAYREIMRMSV